MKLEEGKKYVTRSGEVVTVINIEKAMSSIYSVVAKISCSEHQSFYTTDGRYNVTNPAHDLDIISEYVEPNPTKNNVMKIENNKTYLTRNNKKVRIICTDRDDRGFPVVGLIDNTHMSTYTEDGRCTATTAYHQDLVREYDPWIDVSVDTPVWVKFGPTEAWKPHHFARYTNGKVFVFPFGTTSHSQNDPGVYATYQASLKI